MQPSVDQEGVCFGIFSHSHIYFWSTSATLAVPFLEVRSGEIPQPLRINKRETGGKWSEAISRLINDSSAGTNRHDRHDSLSFTLPFAPRRLVIAALWVTRSTGGIKIINKSRKRLCFQDLPPAQLKE